MIRIRGACDDDEEDIECCWFEGRKTNKYKIEHANARIHIISSFLQPRTLSTFIIHSSQISIVVLLVGGGCRCCCCKWFSFDFHLFIYFFDLLDSLCVFARSLSCLVLSQLNCNKKWSSFVMLTRFFSFPKMPFIIIAFPWSYFSPFLPSPFFHFFVIRQRKSDLNI